MLLNAPDLMLLIIDADALVQLVQVGTAMNRYFSGDDNDAYFYNPVALIDGASCISLAMWSPTEPPAALDIYHAYVIPADQLIQRIFANGTTKEYPIFDSLAVTQCTAAECNAGQGSWSTVDDLSPSAQYLVVVEPSNFVTGPYSNAVEQQVFYLIQAFPTAGAHAPRCLLMLTCIITQSIRLACMCAMHLRWQLLHFCPSGHTEPRLLVLLPIKC